MKIAYVYDAVYPWVTGGVEVRVWELAKRLAEDHDVHWYGLNCWDGPAVLERDGVTLHGVTEAPPLYVDGRRSIGEALRFTAALAGPLARAEFDVIDCQEFPYFPAFPSKLQALARDSTLLLTWHEIWTDYWNEYLGWKGVFGRTVERVTAALPDAHLAVSDRTRDDLGSLGVDDAELLPNGVDMDEIRGAPEADEAVDVLFVGRLIEEKNPALVVEAVDRLRQRRPDVRAVVVGDGPERSRLERLVTNRNLGENVDLRDPLPEYEDVLGLMKAAETFVLPSRREGFGITVLEALGCGTPVVTIDHPQNAASELVDHGETGAVCSMTPESVAEGVELARREGSQGACVSAAEQYEWDRLAERAESIYREVA